MTNSMSARRRARYLVAVRPIAHHFTHWLIFVGRAIKNGHEGAAVSACESAIKLLDAIDAIDDIEDDEAAK